MTIIHRVITNEPIQTNDNRKKKKMSLQTCLNIIVFLQYWSYAMLNTKL